MMLNMPHLIDYILSSIIFLLILQPIIRAKTVTTYDQYHVSITFFMSWMMYYILIWKHRIANPRAVARALIGGWGEYSYFRVMLD